MHEPEIPRMLPAPGYDIRLSLTSAYWRNNNSTIIIGDSNIGSQKFTSFRRNNPTNYINGKFGNALPSKREAARGKQQDRSRKREVGFTIEEIDARK